MIFHGKIHHGSGRIRSGRVGVTEVTWNVFPFLVCGLLTEDESLNSFLEIRNFLHLVFANSPPFTELGWRWGWHNYERTS